MQTAYEAAARRYRAAVSYGSPSEMLKALEQLAAVTRLRPAAEGGGR